MEKTFKCDLCGLGFPSRNKLFQHLKETGKEHGTDAPSIEDSNGESNIAPPPKRQCMQEEPIDAGIVVVSEDENWYRVVVKPQGLATMGPKGVTLLSSNYMLLPDAIKLELSYKKAVPCHRLDKETGGIMLCSKSKLAERTIMTCFRYKLIQKQYLAIVIGKLEPSEGTIETPISGKPAQTKYVVTSYTPSAQFGWISTVQLWPVTGKKHQLRRHLQSVGHSIINDKRFPLPALWDTIVSTRVNNMCLWAVAMDFPHPQYCTELVSSGSSADAATAADEPLTLGESDEDGDDEAEGAVTGVDDDVDVQVALERVDREARQRGIAKRLRALPDECMVHVSIPEPAYYAELRDVHQRSWEEAEQSKQR